MESPSSISFVKIHPCLLCYLGASTMPMFSVEPENFDGGKLSNACLKICFHCGHKNEDSAYVYMYSDKAFCTSTCFIRQMRENDAKDFEKAIERKKKNHSEIV